MPLPGWVAIAVMVFLGASLLVAGWQVRKVRDGRPDGTVSALRAARTLVLAQAAALTGSVLVGWYIANVLVLLPNADVQSQRDRILPFVLHAVVALLLAVVGHGRAVLVPAATARRRGRRHRLSGRPTSPPGRCIRAAPGAR